MERLFTTDELVVPVAYRTKLVLEQAADLIVELAEPLLLRGEVMALQRWLHALREALVQTHAPLVLARIFTAMASGQIATLADDIHLLTAAPALATCSSASLGGTSALPQLNLVMALA